MIDLTVVLTANPDASIATIRELLQKQATLSRQEPGCERFEVYESETVAGTFILLERWASQAALDDHRQAEGVHHSVSAVGASIG